MARNPSIGSLGHVLRECDTPDRLCESLNLEKFLSLDGTTVVLPTWSPRSGRAVQQWTYKLIKLQDMTPTFSLWHILNLYAKSGIAVDASFIVEAYLILGDYLKTKVPKNAISGDNNWWTGVTELYANLIEYHPEAVMRQFFEVGQSFLKSVVNSNLPLVVRYTSIRDLNDLMKHDQALARGTFKKRNNNLFLKLPHLLQEIGDYDTQTCVVEAIYRMSSVAERKSSVSLWFPDLEYTIQSRFITITEFDPDCRQFLNAFNASLGKRRKVYTFPCLSAHIGRLQLNKPSNMAYREFWVDFNSDSRTILILCNKVPGLNDSPETPPWESLTIHNKVVEKVVLTRTVQMHLLEINLASCDAIITMFISPLTPKSQDLITSSFHLEFAPNTDIETLCRKFYDDRFQVMSLEPEGWNGATTRIQCLTPVAQDSIRSSSSNKRYSKSSLVHCQATTTSSEAQTVHRSQVSMKHKMEMQRKVPVVLSQSTKIMQPNKPRKSSVAYSDENNQYYSSTYIQPRAVTHSAHDSTSSVSRSHKKSSICSTALDSEEVFEEIRESRQESGKPTYRPLQAENAKAEKQAKGSQEDILSQDAAMLSMAMDSFEKQREHAEIKEKVNDNVTGDYQTAVKNFSNEGKISKAHHTTENKHVPQGKLAIITDPTEYDDDDIIPSSQSTAIELRKNILHTTPEDLLKLPVGSSISSNSHDITKVAEYYSDVLKLTSKTKTGVDRNDKFSSDSLARRSGNQKSNNSEDVKQRIVAEKGSLRKSDSSSVSDASRTKSKSSTQHSYKKERKIEEVEHFSLRKTNTSSVSDNSINLDASRAKSKSSTQHAHKEERKIEEAERVNKRKYSPPSKTDVCEINEKNVSHPEGKLQASSEHAQRKDEKMDKGRHVLGKTDKGGKVDEKMAKRGKVGKPNKGWKVDDKIKKGGTGKCDEKMDEGKDDGKDKERHRSTRNPTRKRKHEEISNSQTSHSCERRVTRSVSKGTQNFTVTEGKGPQKPLEETNQKPEMGRKSKKVKKELEKKFKPSNDFTDKTYTPLQFAAQSKLVTPQSDKRQESKISNSPKEVEKDELSQVITREKEQIASPTHTQRSKSSVGSVKDANAVHPPCTPRVIEAAGSPAESEGEKIPPSIRDKNKSSEVHTNSSQTSTKNNICDIEVEDEREKISEPVTHIDAVIEDEPCIFETPRAKPDRRDTPWPQKTSADTPRPTDSWHGTHWPVAKLDEMFSSTTVNTKSHEKEADHFQSIPSSAPPLDIDLSKEDLEVMRSCSSLPVNLTTDSFSASEIQKSFMDENSKGISSGCKDVSSSNVENDLQASVGAMESFEVGNHHLSSEIRTSSSSETCKASEIRANASNDAELHTLPHSTPENGPEQVVDGSLYKTPVCNIRQFDDSVLRTPVCKAKVDNTENSLKQFETKLNKNSSRAKEILADYPVKSPIVRTPRTQGAKDELKSKSENRKYPKKTKHPKSYPLYTEEKRPSLAQSSEKTRNKRKLFNTSWMPILESVPPNSDLSGYETIGFDETCIPELLNGSKENLHEETASRKKVKTSPSKKSDDKEKSVSVLKSKSREEASGKKDYHSNLFSEEEDFQPIETSSPVSEPQKKSQNGKSYRKETEQKKGYRREIEQKKGYGREMEQKKGYGRKIEQKKGYEREIEQKKGYGREKEQKKAYGKKIEQRKSYGRGIEHRKSYGREIEQRKSYGRGIEQRKGYGREIESWKSYKRMTEKKVAKVSSSKDKENIHSVFSDVSADERESSEVSWFSNKKKSVNFSGLSYGNRSREKPKPKVYKYQSSSEDSLPLLRKKTHQKRPLPSKEISVPPVEKKRKKAMPLKDISNIENKNKKSKTAMPLKDVYNVDAEIKKQEKTRETMPRQCKKKSPVYNVPDAESTSSSDNVRKEHISQNESVLRHTSKSFIEAMTPSALEIRCTSSSNNVRKEHISQNESVLLHTSKSSIEAMTPSALEIRLLSPTTDDSLKRVRFEVEQCFGFSSPQTLQKEDSREITEPPLRLEDKVQEEEIDSGKNKSSMEEKAENSISTVNEMQTIPSTVQSSTASVHNESTQAFDVTSIEEMLKQKSNDRSSSSGPFQSTMIDEVNENVTSTSAPRFSYISEADTSYTTNKNGEEKNVNENENYYSPPQYASNELVFDDTDEEVEPIIEIPRRCWMSSSDESPVTDVQQKHTKEKEKSLEIPVQTGLETKEKNNKEDQTELQNGSPCKSPYLFTSNIQPTLLQQDQEKTNIEKAVEDVLNTERQRQQQQQQPIQDNMPEPEPENTTSTHGYSDSGVSEDQSVAYTEFLRRFSQTPRIVKVNETPKLMAPRKIFPILGDRVGIDSNENSHTGTAEDEVRETLSDIRTFLEKLALGLHRLSVIIGDELHL